jgi:hypothetical protein
MSLKQKIIVLTWSGRPLLEKNNKGFDIERSVDGRIWTRLEFIPSFSEEGNSDVKLDYMFKDKTPLGGQNFYRLKQLDFDNIATYSGVKMISTGFQGLLDIWPNPTNDYLIIDGLTGTEVVKLLNNNGAVLITREVDGTKHILNLNTLSDGIYYLQVFKNGKLSSIHKVQKHNSRQ